jgi:shikimate dehydrogenase
MLFRHKKRLESVMSENLHSEILNLALIGSGISYSLSPVIHKFSATQLGLKISYELIDLPEENLSSLPDILKLKKISAFNITKPYKTSIEPLFMKGASEAVNTAYLKNGIWSFCSTDYIGFSNALEKKGINLEKVDDVIVLGSGGAVESILMGLSQLISERKLSNKKIHVLNRSGKTPNKLKAFTGLESFEYFLSPEEFSNVCEKSPHALIIQATPLPQLGNDLSEYADILPDNFVGSFYDLTYNQKNLLLEEFNKRSLKADDGLSMLIEQALESQKIWWGMCAPYNLVARHIAEHIEGNLNS